MEDGFPDLKFHQPLGIASAPGDRNRIFVVEKSGRIQVITGLDSGKAEKSVFLDLTAPRDGQLEAGGECGVLGLAFPPDHAKSRRFFVYYSLKLGGKLCQRVSRFETLPDNPNRAENVTEQPLWTQEDPANNHNGGDLHFGPDGYLYISVGDGGASVDTFNQSRFINKGFHSAILRIDVDQRAGSLPPNPHPGIARDTSGASFYSIPADNPFVGATSHHGQSIDPKTVRTEIWATGLRNVWRFSFDATTGRLFAGDVGQNFYEEVNLIIKGGDYGWSYREAMHPFPMGPGKTNEPAGYKPVDPIYEYPRKVGISVTGGVVYRGRGLPVLQGAYVFADFGTGVVIALREKGLQWEAETIAKDAAIAGIGLDPRDGELLFANIAQGKIKRLKKLQPK